jgi:tetratricopeptide (TPR) repeat protein
MALRIRDAMALSGVVLLAACAQAPVATAPVAELPQASPADDARGQAILRHRQLAQKAREAGDLATAAMEWHVVVLLAPDTPAYRREQEAVNAAIRQGVREQLQTGNAALKNGDNERATQAMLRVLALEPGNDEAAKALREIDRQRMARIQTDRAQKLRPVDMNALKGAPSGATGGVANAASNSATNAANDVVAQYDLEQPLEMLRAGDVSGGLRELRAYVDANPGNRAARQRIGNAVADRARELAGKGSREQAYLLYEQAVALRGETTPEWTAQMQALRKALSDEYYSNGERAYRTDVALAIRQWETSLRYDPENLKASSRLRDARAAQEKLKNIPPAK